MLDRHSNFKSYFITKIRNIVGLYYTFCQQLDTSTYVVDLFNKDNYICDNIKNVVNGGHG